MLKVPDKKGPHSCEECGPVCCGSVLGALRRYPNSGPGMLSGVGLSYEASGPSILGLDLLPGSPLHGVTSFRCVALQKFGYCNISLSYIIIYLHITTYSVFCLLLSLDLVFFVGKSQETAVSSILLIAKPGAGCWNN